MRSISQQDNAKTFAATWLNRGYEKGETQSFWLDFFSQVLNVDKASEKITFEKQVLIDGKTKFIDAYLPETRVLIEQKGSHINLQRKERQSDGEMLTPHEQAERYAQNIVGDENPLWIVVCNFRTIEIHNRRKPRTAPTVVPLAELPGKLSVFDFLTDHSVQEITIEKDISVEAGKIVGVLYDKLLARYKEPDDFSLKSLNALCVRLVFCLYAEDAGLFGKRTAFHDYLNEFKPEQIRKALIELFRTLDTPENQRGKYFADDNPLLARFPYVNGGLFADASIEIPPFTEEIKHYLLKNASADFNWREISPSIFGAVFESTLNPETRRSGGMHYTSDENIHKVIDPLFMDALYAEFDQICRKRNIKQGKRELAAFQERISRLKFLDPACGSGNFLTETYLSLRRLENECLKIMLDTENSGIAMNFDDLIKVNIHQFYGIEINDFAVSVAKAALWIAESKMIAETENIVQQNIPFLPLHNYANIVEGNALRLDWEGLVISDQRLDISDERKTLTTKYDYIMGNPPFVGYAFQDKSQKEDMQEIAKMSNLIGKNIDYVSAWYFKAAQLIQNTNTKCAFVSTNSICQGEQVAGVWKPLFETFKVHIDFAYRTFRWDSESFLKAHVHCVIVGFSANVNVGTQNFVSLPNEKIIYDGDKKILAQNINPYLIDAPNVWIESRNKSICDVPIMQKGSIPVDGGNLIIEADEYEDFIKKEPNAIKFIKPLLGSEEYINNKKRYCLWLVGASPAELRKMQLVMERIEAVREFRLKSTKEATRKYADQPTRFMEIRQPETEYILVPRVSSENRRYIPMGFMSPDVVTSDANMVIPSATLYHFGVLTSSVHMAWMRAVCGRLEMRYRYSKDIVYNNFVWPQITTANVETQHAASSANHITVETMCTSSPQQCETIERTAQQILDARANYPDSSLADLYDERTMPADLRRAHQANDRAVLAAYGFNEKMTEAEIVAALFALYRERLENRGED